MKVEDIARALARDIDEVGLLSASRGWSILKEVMRGEILELAGRPSSGDLAQLNFERGAAWAAQRLIELPDRVKFRLEGELALLPPAKAGTPKEETDE